MSHDYDPAWDYPVLELRDVPGLDEKEALCVEQILVQARRSLSPALGFEQGFEAFFVEPLGFTHGRTGPLALAVFCNGTSSRPVVGFDLSELKRECQELDLGFGHQFAISLAHELAHAYQEACGAEDEESGFDEDEAELFARLWAESGQVDLSLLGCGAAQAQAFDSPCGTRKLG